MTEEQHPAPASPALGIPCPQCGCNEVQVIRTEPRWNRIYRRRECRACGRRWTTCEISEELKAKRAAMRGGLPSV